MNTFSNEGSVAWMNAAVMSHCAETHLSLRVSVRMVCIVDHCTTGAHVSKKSTPSVCLFLQMQKRALNFSTVSSGYHLILKVHMDGRTFMPPS